MNTGNRCFFLALLLSLSTPLSWTRTAAAAPPDSRFRCSVTATGVRFPGYNIFTPSPTTGTGTVDVSCNIPPQNPAGPLLVTISFSPGSSGSFAQREMVNSSGDRLSYNIYSDPSYITVLGDGNGSSRTLNSLVDKNAPWSASFFGKIPPNQDSAAGSYGDTITVTVSW